MVWMVISSYLGGNRLKGNYKKRLLPEKKSKFITEDQFTKTHQLNLNEKINNSK